MKKIILSEKNKDLLIILIIITIGCYGSILDYYTEDTLIPSLWKTSNLNIPTFEKENEMSSAWILINAFGLMLLFIKVMEFKSEFKGKVLLKYMLKKIILKIQEGRDLHYEFKQGKQSKNGYNNWK